jgi:hypothetical protein
VLAIGVNGQIIRQSAEDGRTRLSFNAPLEKVWRGVLASYMARGIEPTDASRGEW